MAEHGPAVLIIVLASSLVALAYNLVHYYLLQKTSSITVTVLGEVKIVGLLILSAVILPGTAIPIIYQAISAQPIASWQFARFCSACSASPGFPRLLAVVYPKLRLHVHLAQAGACRGDYPPVAADAVGHVHRHGRLLPLLQCQALAHAPHSHRQGMQHLG